MDAMLMMRPLRAFIIPRSTAFDRRNTEARFVCSTASQSSCFMRSSSMSRVMPALLQRISIVPSFASMSAMTASMDSHIEHNAAAAPSAEALRDAGRPIGGRRRADDAGAVVRQPIGDRSAYAPRCTRHQSYCFVQHVGLLVPSTIRERERVVEGLGILERQHF